jgi:hypothetical protein
VATGKYKYDLKNSMPIMAFQTEKECMATLRSPIGPATKADFWGICLPDTVNPRAPKPAK